MYFPWWQNQKQEKLTATVTLCFKQHKSSYERDCVREELCVSWPSAGRGRRCTPVQLCPQRGHLWEDPAESTYSYTSVQGSQISLVKHRSYMWQANLTLNHPQVASFYKSSIQFPQEKNCEFLISKVTYLQNMNLLTN